MSNEKRELRRDCGPACWLVVLLVAVACGEIESGSNTDMDAVAVTVVDGRGATVMLSGTPGRVVSLAPSCTELVAAVGGEDQLVAVTRWCDDPPGIGEGRVVVPGFDQPDIETLLRLRADLILASDITRPRTVDRLRGVGLPVLVLTGDGLDGVAADLRLTGLVLGRALTGENAAVAFERARAEVRAAVAGLKRPLVFLGFGVGSTYSAGPGSFPETLIEEAGGRNHGSSAAVEWPKVSMEGIVRAQPEILLFTDDSGADIPVVAPAPESVRVRLRAEAGWRDLVALETGQVFLVDGDLFTVPSPRLVTALRRLAEALHGPGMLQE